MRQCESYLPFSSNGKLHSGCDAHTSGDELLQDLSLKRNPVCLQASILNTVCMDLDWWATNAD